VLDFKLMKINLLQLDTLMELLGYLIQLKET